LYTTKNQTGNMTCNRIWNTDTQGNTALHIAIDDGNGVCDITTLEFLLTQKYLSCNINRLNNAGETALDRCYRAYPHLGIPYLLKAGGKGSKQRASDLLCQSCGRQREK
jgi:hypothetical protein